VLGASLGGCVAQVLAAAFPERVASLVLAASFADVDRALELNYRVRIALIDAVGMSSALFGDYVRAQLFGRSFLDTDLGELVSAGAVAMLRDNPTAIYAEHLRALLRFGECDRPPAERSGWRERLARIRCPALVLCGDEDVLTVPALSARMARHLADATLVVQRGCGHANLVEQPDVAADHILRFLRTASPGATLG
jgi:3-oxoadipate enol-lactonase